MAVRAREYQPGERIPGTVYQVLRTIGAGGMGTVYDVEDTTIGKRYVVKTLHPQLGSRDDLGRRMQNEARQLARLHHPNIVEVFTAGVTADDMHLPFYVMERLNGQSLRVVLDKKGQLELPHAYHIMIDLCDALDHAHDKGVIHRDVKPDNIFLHRTSAGVTVTKLLDFAGARRAIERYPQAKIALEHMWAQPMDDPPYRRFEPFFAMAQYPNVYVKTTPNNSHQSRDGKSTPKEFFATLVAKFGARRIMWGSNYPAHWDKYDKIKERLALMQRDLAFLPEEDQRWIFGETALSLWPELR